MVFNVTVKPFLYFNLFYWPTTELCGVHHLFKPPNIDVFKVTLWFEAVFPLCTGTGLHADSALCTFTQAELLHLVHLKCYCYFD